MRRLAVYARRWNDRFDEWESWKRLDDFSSEQGATWFIASQKDSDLRFGQKWEYETRWE